MSMSKAQLRTWPWNNQPSKRHVWKYLGGVGKITGAVEKCERCERTFIERADTRGPVYCYATPTWRAAHPDDDGAEG